jgi:hypothetical protein
MKGAEWRAGQLSAHLDALLLGRAVGELALGHDAAQRRQFRAVHDTGNQTADQPAEREECDRRVPGADETGEHRHDESLGQGSADQDRLPRIPVRQYPAPQRRGEKADPARRRDRAGAEHRARGEQDQQRKGHGGDIGAEEVDRLPGPPTHVVVVVPQGQRLG